MSEIVPGFYRTRLVRGGPWVAVRVAHEPTPDPATGEALDRPPVWSIEIDGKLAREPSPDPETAGVLLAYAMRRIDEKEYRYLLAASRHAKEKAPYLPEAEPKKPINLRDLPPIF
ncbi:MAG: hypothetical protein AAB875_05030 [Patescibacteria group bacterium]